MRDRDGQEHPDDQPVTWAEFIWFFDREMAHRDRTQQVKDDALQTAIELRAKQMLLSHRILIVVVSLIAIGLQVLAFLRK